MTTFGEGLYYVGHVLVRIGGSFSWVDLKRFLFRAPRNDEALLSELISDSHYWDDYHGTDSSEGGLSGKHGPYRLDVLSPHAFRRVPPEIASERLWKWTLEELDDEALDPILTSQLQSQVFDPIDCASAIYTLPDLGLAAMHEWGPVVGVMAGFHEYVVMNQEAGELTLIVASDD